jgi:hypothetical protein
MGLIFRQAGGGEKGLGEGERCPDAYAGHDADIIAVR